jgi:hypothetical protein
MKGLAMELSMLEVMMYVGNYMDMNDYTTVRQFTTVDLERMAEDLEIPMAKLGNILAVWTDENA